MSGLPGTPKDSQAPLSLRNACEHPLPPLQSPPGPPICFSQCLQLAGALVSFHPIHAADEDHDQGPRFLAATPARSLSNCPDPGFLNGVNCECVADILLRLVPPCLYPSSILVKITSSSTNPRIELHSKDPPRLRSQKLACFPVHTRGSTLHVVMR